MSDRNDLDRRLRAVERTLTDGDHDVADLQDAAAVREHLADLENRVEALEEATAELEAATQAVRGYVGNVRSVNQSVEQRADAALAAVDRLESERDRGTVTRTARDHGCDREPNSVGEVDARSIDEAPGTADASDHGIEMPPPGTRTSSDGEDRDGRSVIDRVREAL